VKRAVWIACLAAAALTIAAPAWAAPVTLTVTARDCFQGRFFSSQYTSIGVFETSKATALLRLADRYVAVEKAAERDSAKADELIALEAKLSRAVRSTPALGKVIRSTSPTHTFRIPSALPVTIFVFSLDEGDLEWVNWRQSSLTPPKTEVVFTANPQLCAPGG
jgi:hypothetical protein